MNVTFEVARAERIALAATQAGSDAATYRAGSVLSPWPTVPFPELSKAQAQTINDDARRVYREIFKATVQERIRELQDGARDLDASLSAAFGEEDGSTLFEITEKCPTCEWTLTLNAPNIPDSVAFAQEEARARLAEHAEAAHCFPAGVPGI